MVMDKRKNLIEQFVHFWNERPTDEHQDFYDEDVELVSTLINRTLIDSSGKINGKSTVLSYWHLIKSKYPDVKMNLLNTFFSDNDVLIHCTMPPLSDKVLGLISLNKEGKIVKFKLSHV